MSREFKLSDLKGAIIADAYESTVGRLGRPCIVITFEGGRKPIRIESNCGMSYGDHPCASRETPEVEYAEETSDSKRK